MAACASDFIILRRATDGYWFWDGRGGWANAVSAAHVYPDRAAVEAACTRLRKRGKLPATAGYMTVDEFAESENRHA